MRTNNTDPSNAKQNIKDYLMEFEHLPCGLAMVKNDQFSTLIEANSAFYKIIGYTETELLEKYENHLVEISIDSLSNVITEKTATEDYDFEWDVRIRKADGTIAWIHDAAHYNAKQDVFYLIYTDITDKMIPTTTHLSYDSFQTRNEILGYLNLYIKEQVIVTDADTDEVVYMNSAVSNLLGFHQESDWLGKPYYEIAFGSKENIPSSYYEPVSESEFTVGEFYNAFHKLYLNVKSKIVYIPALNRKMRLNIITDITAQKQLEQKIELQNTVHNCIEALFTAGTTDKNPRDAYHDILNQLKTYYKADGAFFYKFIEGTHDVEAIYRVLADGVKSANVELPVTMTDEQIKMMLAVSNTTPDQNTVVLESFSGDYQKTLMKYHAKYQIDNYVCVAVNNDKDNIVAFMGVTNPQINEDVKDLMKLISRFVCLFIEHEQDHALKEEALTLEAISKKDLVEQSAQNFLSIKHSKENISHTLDALCHHYEADFAIIVSRTEDGAFGVTHMSSGNVPDLSGLQKASHIMGGWLGTFQKHMHFASDLDFDDAKSPMIKKLLRDKFGIHNFVASPMRDANGALTGLLIVNNLSLINRSHLMVHVVSKDIADYLDRVRMQETIQLEPATQLTNKVSTEHRIAKLLEKGTTGTLFIIDIDKFKQLNDTLGHQSGDQAILDVAAVLKQLFRSTDIIGRIGGDEFMVFSPGLVSDALIAIKASKIQEKCRRNYVNNESTTEISVSVGVCSVADGHNTFHALYAKTDYALYIAKKNGRNQYYIYSPTEQNLENLGECEKTKSKKLSWWKRLMK